MQRKRTTIFHSNETGFVDHEIIHFNVRHLAKCTQIHTQTDRHTNTQTMTHTHFYSVRQVPVQAQSKQFAKTLQLFQSTRVLTSESRRPFSQESVGG